MADLCIKQNGIIKKYELKDSVSSSPKLVVKQGGYIRYLPLKQGTKSGELSLRVQGKTYYVQTKPYVDFDKVSLLAPLGANSGGGKCAIWPIYNDQGVILAAIVSNYLQSYHSYTEWHCDTSPVTREPLALTVDYNFSPGKYDKFLVKVARTRQIQTDGSENTTNPAPAVSSADTVGEIKNLLLDPTVHYKNAGGSYVNTSNTNDILDYSVTGSDWATYYANSNQLQTSRCSYDSSRSSNYMGLISGAGSYLQIGVNVKDKRSGSQYLQISGYGSATNCWSEVGSDMYIEFPENGLIGASPADVITEWAAALSSSYDVYTNALKDFTIAKNYISANGGMLSSAPATKTVTDSNGYTHTVTTTKSVQGQYTYDKITCGEKTYSWSKYYYGNVPSYGPFHYGGSYVVKGVACDNNGHIYVLRNDISGYNTTGTPGVVVFTFDPSTGYTVVTTYS